MAQLGALFQTFIDDVNTQLGELKAHQKSQDTVIVKLRGSLTAQAEEIQLLREAVERCQQQCDGLARFKEDITTQLTQAKERSGSAVAASQIAETSVQDLREELWAEAQRIHNSLREITGYHEYASLSLFVCRALTFLGRWPRG